MYIYIYIYIYQTRPRGYLADALTNELSGRTMGVLNGLQDKVNKTLGRLQFKYIETIYL